MATTTIKIPTSKSRREQGNKTDITVRDLLLNLNLKENYTIWRDRVKNLLNLKINTHLFFCPKKHPKEILLTKEAIYLIVCQVYKDIEQAFYTGGFTKVQISNSIANELTISQDISAYTLFRTLLTQKSKAEIIDLIINIVKN